MFKITMRAFLDMELSKWFANLHGVKRISRGSRGRRSSRCSFKAEVGVPEQRGRVLGTAADLSPKIKNKGRILPPSVQAAQSTWPSSTFYCEENGSKRTASPVSPQTHRVRAELLLRTCKRLSLVRCKVMVL